MKEELVLQADDKLVALYISGLDEAFDILLERYKDRLYSYIYYHIHNADMANDLFQETFVKAITTLRQGRYTENGKFYSWLTRIAHNLIIDQFRAERNNNVVSNDSVEADLYNMVPQTEGSRESKYLVEQTLEDVCKLMNHLPESQKEVVKMRIYQELSFKEISELKGISINTALGRMRYAIMNMRRMAKEHNIALYTE